MIATGNKAKEIFVELIAQCPPSEWDARLAAACGGDEQLRQRVQSLLRAHQDQDSFPIHPADPDLATIDRPPAEYVGSQIGPYKLLEQIGEGGMGLVYMAQQQHPVRRLVALKIIKPGMDSKQVIARFEAERQALAMMDHPNIAKILDAGTVGVGPGRRTGPDAQSDVAIQGPAGPSGPSGRPYFVMELVRGMPITEFCDQKQLSVPDRLKLVIDVCHAVQHAHQKGIIHRDLKPTNVLITLADTVPFPKIIDFGIAKALGQSLTDHTLHTGYAQLVGTPLYMSPEQAELNLFGVDTRSDVYSLGVLLYELLTGTTPFDKDRLKSATFDELRRIIREEEPETVSARIAKTRGEKSRVGSDHQPAAASPATSTSHQHSRLLSWLKTENRKLKTFAELDWIVMRALEKDRTRRYESPSALAADIQRYLSDEPVLACPPTTMYRFQKFARKHKPALFTAAAIALCLLLGTTVSAWQAIRATAAEEQAAANESQAKVSAQKADEKAKEATQERDEAQKQRDEVKALADKLAAKEQQLQRTLYAAHMNLAKNAWDASDIGRVNELLDEHRPKAGDTDQRGFEWYFLHRLCHSELGTLKGHNAGVNSVAFSPDGKRLATGSDDKTVKVWNVQTHQELLTLKGQTDVVLSVVFSPDGKRLAAGSKSEVKLWDAHAGQELLTFKGAHGGVAFSPDGNRLASTVWDEKTREEEVKVWETQTGQELVSLPLKSAYGSVAYSPDGTRLASTAYDGTVKVWDAQTRQELLSLKVAITDYGASVVFSPDSKRLAAAASGPHVVKVWDGHTGQELLSLKEQTGWISGVDFSPDGQRLAIGLEDGTVKIRNAHSGELIQTFYGHTDSVNSVMFSRDGLHVASGSGDKAVKVWDTQQETLTLQAVSGKRSALSRDFKRLATATLDHTVNVWDTQTGQQTLTLKGHTAAVDSLAFSPDGNRLVTGVGGQWAPGGGMLTKPGDRAEVKVWDARTGKDLLTLPAGLGHVTSVAFSLDGNRLASTSTNHDDKSFTLKVWDAQTGQELHSLKGGFGSVVFSPDGKRLASAVWDETTKKIAVKVWDAQTGQQLLALKGGNAVAFSPDSERLATGGKVWDVQTGNELLSLKDGGGSMVFSPDGKRLVTASWGKTVKVWDAQTGQELLALTLHGSTFTNTNLEFSPDGNRLASIDPNGTVKYYDATPLPEK